MVDLVTGANGFVGSHLLKALRSRGRTVRALVRQGSDFKRIEECRDSFAFGDLRDIESLRKALQGVGRVFHCAARVSDWGDEKDFREANVMGTANLLRAAKDAGAARFVHVSTTDVYGYPGYPAEESAPYRYRGFPYADTKIIAEKIVWEYSSEQGLPVTVLRPASIYGIDSITLVKDIVDLLRKGEMIHLGKASTPAGLCHVDNLVHAILLAADSPKSLGQAYNVTDGSGIGWREYVNSLADAIGSKRPGIALPHLFAYFLGSLMEGYGKLMRMGTRPLLTRMAAEIFCTTQEFSIEKIKRDLGYAPIVSFKDFLKDLGATGPA
jgi:nucleoside-diphosphate-sugar epimerase